MLNLTKSTVTVTETEEGWESDTGRFWRTAAEAERQLRAERTEAAERGESSVLTIHWEPKTCTGAAVVRAIVLTAAMEGHR